MEGCCPMSIREKTQGKKKRRDKSEVLGQVIVHSLVSDSVIFQLFFCDKNKKLK